jgi:hypothetical protein
MRYPNGQNARQDSTAPTPIAVTRRQLQIHFQLPQTSHTDIHPENTNRICPSLSSYATSRVTFSSNVKGAKYENVEGRSRLCLNTMTQFSSLEWENSRKYLQTKLIVLHQNNVN